jgi:hypothetical protein
MMSGKMSSRMSEAVSRLRRGDDSGTSLILALIFITVGAVVLAALLSLADASMRTTIQLRGQAANVAAADGAGKAAINALRQGTNTYSSGFCFGSGAGGSNTLPLPNFYQPAGSAVTSATVTCEPDTTHSTLDPSVQVSGANAPLNAILTLATTASGEDGLNTVVGGNRTLRVRGKIFSNSTIKSSQGTLTSNTSVKARGSCTGTITSTPAPQCGIGGAADPGSVDPNYAVAGGSTTLRSVPACVGNNKLVTFTPGLYTDVASLNTMTSNSGCKDSIFYFPAGTYYFNFPSSTEWLIDTGWVVGGTPTSALVAGTPPTMPGSCKSPIPPSPPGGWTRPGPNEGVQFVFGGGSHIRIKGAQAELCGSYSPIMPPIAVYGLKSAVGSVPAQSGCVTTQNYPSNSSACAMIKTDQSPNNALYIQGTTYAPRAALDIELNNATGQVFRWGVIARTLFISPTGSANLSGPVIEVPDDNIDGGLTNILYLNVYICPGSASCTVVTGLKRLRVKVAVVDPSGLPIAGARQVTVYSWSVLRG